MLSLRSAYEYPATNPFLFMLLSVVKCTTMSLDSDRNFLGTVYPQNVPRSLLLFAVPSYTCANNIKTAVVYK